MQAQRLLTRTEQAQSTAITLDQSLQTVKSLLSASFSCITYLRGILPKENFTDGFITARSSSSRPGLNAREHSSSQASSMKLKAVRKGYSAEGDKLLDYLELGIFDALEKGYLKSFLFAVYLDPEEPNNIVECFTFNFTYHRLPGTDIMVPLLTGLSNRMDSLSLGRNAQIGDAQAAIAKGKVPTLGEVKSSIKKLIRNFIEQTKTLEDLPNRRFVTFKLFYMDETPWDYEPPLFKAGDAEKDKFFFTTHSVNEKPEKVSVGTVDTVFHGVSVDVTTISNLIPTADDSLNSQPFDRFTTAHTGFRTIQSEMEKVGLREEEIRAQKEDARARRIVWDAEMHVAGLADMCDGDGSPDPDFVGEMFDPAVETPIGMRSEDGRIVPVPAMDSEADAMEIERNLHMGSNIDDADYDRAQQVSIRDPEELTQAIYPVILSLNPEYGEHGSFHPHANGPGLGDDSVISHGLNTLEIENKLAAYDLTMNSESALVEIESLDMEPVQLKSAVGVNASALHNVPRTANSGSVTSPHIQSGTRTLRSRAVLAERSINLGKSAAHVALNQEMQHVCSCDTNAEADEWCQCEGKCAKWYHVWCMGYHSIEVFLKHHPNDGQTEKKWICFECRFLEDPRVDLLNDKDKEEKISQFKDLALFRRTLKVVTGTNGVPDGPGKLKKSVGCEAAMAGMLWKRLEKEGFIAPEQEGVDSVGLLHTTTVQATKSNKGKKQKVRKNLKRPKYGLVKTRESEQALNGYFDPAEGLEEKLMGFKDMMRAAKQQIKRNKPHYIIVPTKANSPSVERENTPNDGNEEQETQTQFMPNSLPAVPLSGTARGRLNEADVDERPKKRVKVSLAEEGVDVEH